MKRLVLTLLALLVFGVIALWPSTAEASGYYNGYTTSSGYVYNAADTYWYHSGVPYTRTLYTQPGYYSGCNYYPSYQYYTYYPVANYSPAKVITYKTPDYRTELVKLAAAQQKEVLEQQGFESAVNVLGLTGQFRVANYGRYANLPIGQSYFNNAIVGNYGASGQTLYGFKATADLYGSTDLNSLYQQASRLAVHGQELGGQATQQFQGLVAQAGGNAAAVAEIQSKGNALFAAIQAAGQAIRPEPRGTGTVTTYTYGAAKTAPMANIPAKPEGNGNGIGQPPAAGQPADLEKLYVALVENKCAACHVGDKAKGKFDLNKMTAEQRITAIDRITTEDPKLFMPRNAADESKPGTPLTPGEQLLFFRGSKR